MLYIYIWDYFEKFLDIDLLIHNFPLTFFTNSGGFVPLVASHIHSKWTRSSWTSLLVGLLNDHLCSSQMISNLKFFLIPKLDICKRNMLNFLVSMSFNLVHELSNHGTICQQSLDIIFFNLQLDLAWIPQAWE